MKLTNAQWLQNSDLQTLLDILSSGSDQARVNGGAVRNSLLGVEVGDVDISTLLTPQQVMETLKHHQIKAIPTGFDHGTVTAVMSGQSFEITTLREDIRTDGRHAEVVFGTDWTRDARRRDFTMNALYCDRHGTVLDPLGGLEDLQARQVRFIGNPETRIREDYLRILRFFRFFAHFGAGRPDAAGLRACAKAKSNLSRLSVERIWKELQKLLAAKDPGRALLWMRTTGVLDILLPESSQWGIDGIHPMVEAERNNEWIADPIIRLMCMVPPRQETLNGLSDRLKVSNATRKRLLAWSDVDLGSPQLQQKAFVRHVYGQQITAIRDALRIEIATRLSKPELATAREARLAQLTAMQGYQHPKFPVKAAQLIALGFEPGPNIGKQLKMLETVWRDSDFSLSAKDLLAQLPA